MQHPQTTTWREIKQLVDRVGLRLMTDPPWAASSPRHRNLKLSFDAAAIEIRKVMASRRNRTTTELAKLLGILGKAKARKAVSQ